MVVARNGGGWTVDSTDNAPAGAAVKGRATNSLLLSMSSGQQQQASSTLDDTVTPSQNPTAISSSGTAEDNQQQQQHQSQEAGSSTADATLLLSNTINNNNNILTTAQSQSPSLTCLLPPQIEDVIGHITNGIRNGSLSSSNLNHNLNNILNNNNSHNVSLHLHNQNNNNNNNNNGSSTNNGSAKGWWTDNLKANSNLNSSSGSGNNKMLQNNSINLKLANAGVGISVDSNGGGANQLPKAILKCRPNSHPFQARTLTLIPNVEVKVGRAVARHPVSDSNAIFDCKVLSRNHAVLWFSDDKFFIRDMGSSNGTFVNNQRLSQTSLQSEKFEICSGDIVQFGVDVIENARKETHGCIVATVKLYLPDGREAKASQLTCVSAGSNNVPAEDLYRLHQYIQEALQREHVLETKMEELQRLVELAKANVNQNWQAMVDEDRLLNRIDNLETRLQSFQKNYGEDKLRDEIRQLQDDKMDYQHAAKEALRRVYQDRYEAIQKLSGMELALRNSEDECSLLRDRFLKADSDLNETMNRLSAIQHSHDELLAKYKELESKLQTMEQQRMDFDPEQIAHLLREKELDQEQQQPPPPVYEPGERAAANLMKLFANSDLKNLEVISSICNAPEQEEEEEGVSVVEGEEVYLGGSLDEKYSKILLKLTDVEKNIVAVEKCKELRSFPSQTSLSSAISDEDSSDNKSVCSSTSTLIGGEEEKTDVINDLVKTIIEQLKEIYQDVVNELETIKSQLVAQQEAKARIEELENQLTAREKHVESITKELNDRPTSEQFLEKVKLNEDLQIELVSIQLKVAELREQLDKSVDAKKALEEELKSLQATSSSGTKKSPTPTTTGRKQSVHQEQQTEIEEASTSKTISVNEATSSRKEVSKNEAFEQKLDEFLLTEPVVEAEEELVLFKEQFKALSEENVRLQKDLNDLTQKYKALQNTSLMQLMMYFGPVVALLSYFILWPYL